jgi:putative hemolysin
MGVTNRCYGCTHACRDRSQLCQSLRQPADPLIHLIEATTGQLELKRLYSVYQTELRGSVDFWEAAMRLMRLSVDYDPKKLDALPRSGPLVIVANHPFGLIDGLLIGHLANRVRRDFKVLTNSRLYPPDAEIRNYILPIDFDPTPTAQETNLRSRAIARAHLKGGGRFSATIGDVLPYETLREIRDPRTLCRYLRDRTEALAAFS